MRQQAGRAVGQGHRGPKARITQCWGAAWGEVPREAHSIEGFTLDLLQCSQQARPRVDSKSRDGAPGALTGRLISLVRRCSGLTSCVPYPNPAHGRFPGTPGVPPGKGNLGAQTGGQGCSEPWVRLSV